MPILRPADEISMASWTKRDTLDNIRETGEFVVNVPPWRWQRRSRSARRASRRRWTSSKRRVCPLIRRPR
ncbi:MAG TPA: hypothetical protein PLZ42_02070 [Methanothrix sp.]|nr:hypothetical protein [Methanothrix sp.]